ncbi:uncharacterized protein LOC126692000 isoform X1 [Quercus robur]|uniref:uncharacterized protein LOC126692000 isoform X1 n=2 Tax=Quercus robur TaxID=38942 RepID=UPI0021612168|nr:uncharacterized protein LOC126692000 isoform X1 [Quercus robur]
MELVSSFSVFAPSSSSSSNDVPAPKMADPSAAEGLKLSWTAPLEKQFIDFLLEEKAKGNIPNGKMKKKRWPFVTDVFIQRTGKHCRQEQITEKFKRLKQKYRAFSLLIGRFGMECDLVTNTVTGSEAAWSEAVALNPRCKGFYKKGLDHYELLRQLFHTGMATGFLQTSSVQGVHVSVEPYSSDDVVKLPPPDMGQCSNPKGKQPAHPDTSTGKKRKAGSFDRATNAIVETEMSRISRDKDSESRKTIDSAQVLDPLSMVMATEIVNSMFDSLGDETMFEVLEKLEKPECRQAFIKLKPERRRGWIEQLTSLP